MSFTKVLHNDTYDAISPFRPELSAEGKNVIVTGGGTGIGKAIAKSFAQAKAASVSILGRREDRLITASKEISEVVIGNTRVLYRVTDLMDRPNVDDSFKSIVNEVGRIHILVSNAGVLGERGSVADFDLDKILNIFDLNLRAPLNAVQAFLPVAAESPVVISISTASLHIPPMPGAVAYTASKLASLKAFEHLAFENPGLHVVQLHPGVVRTEINEGIPGMDKDKRKWFTLIQRSRYRY